jgi:plasmid stabilization system protein ParE
MLIDIGLPLPQRTLLVDQEDFDVSLPRYESYEPAPEELEAAAAYIDELRSGSVDLAQPRDLGMSWKRMRNFARLTWRATRKKSPGDHNAHPRTFALDYLRQRARLSLINRIADAEPRHERAIFYPWHFAADSNVTVRGEPYRNQLLLLEHLAGSLPYGYNLWLKPHPACAGELPLSRLMMLQRSLGNLRLIHPSVPAQEILRRVDAVVTVSSTAGFEALVLGIPVITLGKSYYRGHGLTYDIGDLSELPFVLARALSDQPPERAELERLIAYYIHVSRDLSIIGEDPSPENAGRYVDALIEEFELSAAPPSAGRVARIGKGVRHLAGRTEDR